MLRYAFDKAQRLGVIEYTGVLDHATMLRYMQTIWDDPECDSAYSAICDFSNAHLKMKPMEIKDVFFQIVADERSLKGSCALVISTPMETALGLIFKNMAQKEHDNEVPALAVQIFYEWENACDFVRCFGDKNSFNWKTIE